MTVCPQATTSCTPHCQGLPDQKRSGFTPDERYGSCPRALGLQYLIFLECMCNRLGRQGLYLTTYRVDYEAIPHWERSGFSCHLTFQVKGQR